MWIFRGKLAQTEENRRRTGAHVLQHTSRTVSRASGEMLWLITGSSRYSFSWSGCCSTSRSLVDTHDNATELQMCNLSQQDTVEASLTIDHTLSF